MAERTAIQLLEEQNVLLREQNHVLGKLLECQQALLDRVLRGPPGGTQRAPSNGAPTQQGGKVASDRDLDGQYGDPTVRKLPKGWHGPDYEGYHFSETDTDFLEHLAKDLDGLAQWMHGKGENKKAGYKELDAARARGWAKRLRSGYRPSARPAEENEEPSL